MEGAFCDGTNTCVVMLLDGETMAALCPEPVSRARGLYRF